jgi:hypothetical protein
MNYLLKPNKVLIVAGLVLMSAMLGSNVYAQGKSDGKKQNEGICDPLLDATKGLHGLCTAFCEAQTCTASVDTTKGIVTFDESCKVSSPKLLENYNKRAKGGDPAMPCVNVPEIASDTDNNDTGSNDTGAVCPCWTAAQLSQVADGDPGNSCITVDGLPIVEGADGMTGNADLAMLHNGGLISSGPSCHYTENSPVASFGMNLDQSTLASCVASIEAECKTR